MIRSSLVALLALACPLVARAAVPIVLTHDGYLLAADDSPVSTPHTFELAIYKNATPPASGPDATWWTATPVELTPKAGYYSILVGGSETGALNLDVFDSAGERWLGVKVNGIALFPRHRVAATPYALVAQRAAEATHAVNADEATHAASADEATHAANADAATFATSAGSATTAGSATSAASATNADKLDNLDSTAFALATHQHDAAYLRLDGSNALSAPLGTLSVTAGIGTTPLAVNYTATTSTYRRPITITNGGSSGLTDFQLALTIDTQTPISAGKMRSDAGDLRVVAADGTTAIPFWIESGVQTTTTKVWARLPSIPVGATTIYVTYGNASLASAGDASAVFLFYDGFDTYTGWTQVENTCLTSNAAGASGGVLSVKCGSSDSTWRSNRIEKAMSQTLSSGAYAFRLRARGGYTSGNNCGGPAGALVGPDGNQRLFVETRSYVYCNGVSNNSIFIAGTQGPQTNPLISNLSGSFTLLETTFDLGTKTATHFTNGVQGTTVVGTFATSLSKVSFWASNYGNVGEEVQVDEVLVRRNAATMPTASVGTETSSSAPSTQTGLVVQADTGRVGVGTTAPTSRVDVRGGYVTDDRTFYVDYTQVNGASTLPFLGRTGLAMGPGTIGVATCTAMNTGFLATSSWIFESSDNGTTDAPGVTRSASTTTAWPTPELYADTGDNKLKLRLFGGSGATTTRDVRCRVELVSP